MACFSGGGKKICYFCRLRDCIMILPVHSCDGIIKYELQIFSEENSDGNITG